MPAPLDTVYTVDIDGEAVLLDEATGRLHRLNTSAALLWRCFDGRSPLAEIVDDVSETIGVPRERVASDSLAIVRHLIGEGLLADSEAT